MGGRRAVASRGHRGASQTAGALFSASYRKGIYRNLGRGLFTRRRKNPGSGRYFAPREGPPHSGQIMKNVFIHPKALVETKNLGSGTRVWAFAHVMAGVRVGKNCNIGDHCFVESGAVIGDNCTVKNGNMLWEGVTLEDGVFVGPNVLFTNDLHPRSPRLPQARER